MIGISYSIFKHLEMVIKQIKYINRAKNEDYIEKQNSFEIKLFLKSFSFFRVIDIEL